MSTRAIQDGMMLLGYRDPTTDEWLAGGSVEFYAAGTSNAKNAWEDKDKASAITSVTLDSSGQAQVYFDGVYKFIVKDSAGTTKYTFDNLKFQARNTSTLSKTANYTATVDDDYILCDTDGGAFTITLPAVSGVVAPITIKNVGSSGNDVTVDGSGAETIDGAATVTIVDNQSVPYVTDGVQWYGAGPSGGVTNTDVVGDIYASNGTSKVLENGSDGTDAIFTGTVGVGGSIDAAAAAGSTFTGGTIYYYRVGSVVTIAWESITLSLTSSANSGTGAIPVGYRPTSGTYSGVYAAITTSVQGAAISSTGLLTLESKNWSGVAYNVTSMINGSISFIVS